MGITVVVVNKAGVHSFFYFLFLILLTLVLSSASGQAVVGIGIRFQGLAPKAFFTISKYFRQQKRVSGCTGVKIGLGTGTRCIGAPLA